MITKETLYSWPARSKMTAEESRLFANEILEVIGDKPVDNLDSLVTVKSSPGLSHILKPGNTKKNINDLPFEIERPPFARKMRWGNAFASASMVGPNWRLPSIAELRVIYECETDFVKSTYWSCDLVDGLGLGALAFDFSDGTVQEILTTTICYVRLVRTK